MKQVAYQFDPYFHTGHIFLAGLGGTGSHLAHNLARLLYHRKALGQSIPQLTFVDDDKVEAKNVGRQNFEMGLVGEYKSVALAMRYNYALGLDIASIPSKIQASMIPRDAILIGAVDNYLARRELAKSDARLWIDCGNEKTTGQVVIGTTSSQEQITKTIRHALTQAAKEDVKEVSFHDLPNIALLHPEILNPPPPKELNTNTMEIPEQNLSCAQLLAMDDQSLFINQAMALIVGEYVRCLFNRIPITTYATYYNGDHLNMRSLSINPHEMASQLNIDLYESTAEQS